LNNMVPLPPLALAPHVSTSSCREHPYLPILITRKRQVPSPSLLTRGAKQSPCCNHPILTQPNPELIHKLTEVHRYKTRPPPQRRETTEKTRAYGRASVRGRNGAYAHARAPGHKIGNAARRRFTARQSWLV
jgi:hypothetical protein